MCNVSNGAHGARTEGRRMLTNSKIVGGVRGCVNTERTRLTEDGLDSRDNDLINEKNYCTTEFEHCVI